MLKVTLMNEMSSVFSLQLYLAIPAVMKLLPGPHNKIFALYGDVLAFLRQEVETHKLDFDPSNPRDYIDVFIEEMEKVHEQTALHNNTHILHNICCFFQSINELTLLSIFSMF